MEQSLTIADEIQRNGPLALKMAKLAIDSGLNQSL